MRADRTARPTGILGIAPTARSTRPACRRFGRLLLGVGLAFAPGCVVLEGSIGRPRSAEAVAVTPGQTRADVLARLGPPDEFADPVPLYGFRAWDPGTLRVLQEHDLFGRRTWTWTAELQHDRIVLIPFLFTWWRTRHRADRVQVVFDERGRVETVARETFDLPGGPDA